MPSLSLSATGLYAYLYLLQNCMPIRCDILIPWYPDIFICYQIVWLSVSARELYAFTIFICYRIVCLSLSATELYASPVWYPNTVVSWYLYLLIPNCMPIFICYSIVCLHYLYLLQNCMPIRCDILIPWYPDIWLTPLSDPLPLITPTHLPDWTLLSQCQTLYITSPPS